MLVEAGAAGAAGAAGLFTYNRENFLYDRALRQEAEYAIMDFRIDQAKLWREDAREIIGLTAVKMDTYLIISSTMLGACVMAYIEGRLYHDTPAWLVSCYSFSLTGAFIYFLMSLWFALNASVAAKSYQVRLLTQHIRLPMPTWAQVEGSRTYGSSFEKVDGRQMFRVPFIQGRQEQVLERSGLGTRTEDVPWAPNDPSPSLLLKDDFGTNDAQTKRRSADFWGLEACGDDIYELDGRIRGDPSQLEHFQLIYKTMPYWQSYDGFARASMSIGANQFVTALSYYIIGHVAFDQHVVMPAVIPVVLFMCSAVLLIRLDMSLSCFEYSVAVVLVTFGPFFATVCTSLYLRTHLFDELIWSDILDLMPFVFFSQALWLTFLLYICKVSKQENGPVLPTGFRSVMYIDVFGWIKQTVARTKLGLDVENSSSEASLASAHAFPRVYSKEVGCDHGFQPGCGPATQSVSYDSCGLPLPMRPEDLLGAAQRSETMRTSSTDFMPTTFVPEEVRTASTGTEAYSLSHPGLVPWRIFSTTTALLIVLWIGLGIVRLLEQADLTFLTVAGLYHAHHEEHDGHHDVHDETTVKEHLMMISLGRGEKINTSWPRVGLRAHSLACGNADARGAPLFLASTRFGMFTARLADDAGVAGRRASKAVFGEIRGCQKIEGEALQDVALHCADSLEKINAVKPNCSALVLHRQGRRLTSCPLSANGGGFEVDGSSRLVSMSDGDSQEALASFAAGSVEDSGENRILSAYAETTSGRIVELRDHLGFGLPDSELLFPSRVLTAYTNSERSRGGTLAMLGPERRYVTVLRPDMGVLEIVDLRGKSPCTPPCAQARTWHLPKTERWSAVCSFDNSLYLLSDEPSPQIWRFPVPTTEGSFAIDIAPRQTRTASGALPSRATGKLARRTHLRMSTTWA